MEKLNITIIGAGVIGLAIAAKLSESYERIVVLERNNTFGQETSSRNSEVIHSGIYYPTGSLKARLCVEGAKKIYELCERFNIPHKRIGKLIVATEKDEVAALEDLFEKGKRNCGNGFTLLGANDVAKIEPNIKAVKAIYSPNTGIVDSHSLMKHYYDSARDRGVIFAFKSEVTKVEKTGDGFVVGVNEDEFLFKTHILINCAGLFGDRVAELAGVNIKESKYKIKFCKGTYFSYHMPSPVNRLVYPIPHEELVGLGVHATLNLAGRLRFGPDVEYVETIDYKVDENKKRDFYMGAAKLLPSLQEEHLIPDQAGIRPKLYGYGEQVRDFVVKDETENNLRGLISLIGIESPGLTASPAIASMVRSMVLSVLN
jgi:L-2-hydroxyglutarate oxidase LhgO